MMYELFDEETMRKQLEAARSRRDIETGKIAVALNMLSKGKLTVDEIAEYSGLALDKVRELSAQISPAAHA